MKNKYKKADYIFKNGKVITVNKNDDIASAVAISDNKIIYVGNDKEAMTYKIDETEVIDLEGKSMTPGFVDAHAHTALNGLIKSVFVDINPTNAPSLEKLFSMIEERVKITKPGKWIVFWGYDEFAMSDKRPPHIDEIDALTKDNPVLVARCDGHTGVYNSKALEIGKFNLAKAKEYASGEVSYTNGRLDGLLVDNAYYDMWNFIEFEEDAVVEGLRVQSEAYAKVGVTSVHDAGGFGKITNYGYKNAVELGKFKIRATPMPFSMLGKKQFMKDIDNYVELGFSTYMGNDRLKFGLMKVMIDGGSSLPSCSMVEPYSHKNDDYGVLLMEPEEIDEIVLKLHRTGHQITAHAVGDRAIDLWLSAIEKAQKTYPREDCRHRIEHSTIMNDDLIARVKRLGCIPISNPRFIYQNGDRYIEFFGDRVNMLFPSKSYLEAGICSAMATDNPIINENPLLGISSSITRKSLNGTDVGINQKITTLEAIRMYTYNGIYSTFDEDILGSIEEGKLADIAVFDGDLLTATAEELETIKCILTMVDGEIIYQA